MIKANKGVVEMKGNAVDLLGEVFTILKSARENFGDKHVDFVVEESKKSDEKLHEETEKLKEKEKIVKDFIDLIFNGEEK